MTSKNLFFKLIKQDFQKRIWCPILIFIGYFLAFEVRLLMTLESIEENIKKGYNSYYYKSLGEYVEKCFFGTNVNALALLVCFTAFLCAISGFSYLHSKVQLDTYHSLPVNRIQLFISKYVSGVLQFFIPFVLHMVVCMGICVGKDAFSGAALVNAVELIGVLLLVFLLTYAVVIMAVCLTGNIIISMLGSVVLFCYSTVVAFLAEVLFSRFFDTYVSINNNAIGDRFWAFSPLAMLIKLFSQDNYTADYESFKYNADYLWVIAVAAAVYTAIAYVLYQRRASESAGRAIAYWWAEPVLKTLMVVPVAFYSGSFFSEIAGDDYYKGPWYWFGIIFGYLIFALLFEIIFRFDVKSALHHKGQLAFNAACVALIAVILRYDALGYDTYVPNESELESCAVSIEGLMGVSPVINGNNPNVVYYMTMGMSDYRMERVAIHDNPSVLALARKAAAEGYRYEDLDDDMNDYGYILFGFNRKNGKSVYRKYIVDITDEETLALIADIFNDSSYKEGTNPLLSEGWKKEYDKLYCMGEFTNAVLDMTPAFQTKLLDTYQKEYMELDFSTVLDTYPVGGMAFATEEMQVGRQNWNNSYIFHNSMSLIYPQFTKTIALLKENGFDVYATIPLEDILYIEVEYYRDAEDDDGYPYCESVDLGKIYDKEQQQNILDSIYTTEYSWQISSYADFFDEDFGVRVGISSNDGVVEEYRFKNGMVPDFIYEVLYYELDGDLEEQVSLIYGASNKFQKKINK